MSKNLNDNIEDDQMDAEESPPIFIKPSVLASSDKALNQFESQTASCSQGGARAEDVSEQVKVILE